MATVFKVQAAAWAFASRTYHDTFDWRVFAAGGVIEEEAVGKTLRLNWRSLGGCRLYASFPVMEFPRHARDLPAGPLRDRLGEILGVRALLPSVTLRCRTRGLALTDRSEKTVLRVVVEDCRLDKGSRARIRRVRLFGLKGYSRAFERIRMLLEHELGLHPGEYEFFYPALAAKGRHAGEFSSKLDIRLDPRCRADMAAKIIVRRLFATLQATEDGVRSDLDSEFLHDFRVAIQRTRAALTQIKHVFPVRVVKRYREELAWLGRATGPARDADVYLLAFDSYQGSLPEAMREHLEPLRAYLHEKKARTHDELVAALDSARYRRLVTGWSRFLRREVPRRSSLPNAMRPATEVAGRRILRLYRTITSGPGIRPETPAPVLHEVRKSCKKLRYLLEFFGSLYPAEQIREHIKTLRSFQDSLGHVQDLAVQIDGLQRFGGDLLKAGRLAPEALLAFGTLVGVLVERQGRSKEHFAARFADFAGPDKRARFEASFTDAGMAAT